MKLQELTLRPDGLSGGHGLCAGCAESVVVRQVVFALENPAVVSLATGCLEVATTRFPDTAWQVPVIHSAFENAASTASGIDAAYAALVRKGRIEPRKFTIVVFAGDGATYDIGLQWLSGALERGHRFVYVCLNNEGYMNTGVQRSGATFAGTWTTTTPAGSRVKGKPQWRKDLTAIVAAHGIPYVAQAAVHNWKDLIAKVRRAEAAAGPSFVNVLAPCNRGWRHEPEDTMSISRLAVETGLWPLYEVVDGTWRLTGAAKKSKPVTDYLKAQGRFRHLQAPGAEKLVAEIQDRVDGEWRALTSRCAAFKPPPLEGGGPGAGDSRVPPPSDSLLPGEGA
ncbi:MAG: pyruvate ferredoxin oxidoreductase [Chloroflexi bacterium]|nr:pyruvate ferredoxin oxidoreductase [Chloroflexota bacterium]